MGRITRPARVDGLGLLSEGEAVGAWSFTLPPMGPAPTSVRLAPRPAALDALPEADRALAVLAHGVHPVVPVPGADERQAALAEFEAVQNGAHAVVV